MNTLKISQVLLFMQSRSSHGLFESHCVDSGVLSFSGTGDTSYIWSKLNSKVLGSYFETRVWYWFQVWQGPNKSWRSLIHCLQKNMEWHVLIWSIHVLLKHSCYSNCLELEEQKIFFWEACSHRWQCVALPAHSDNKKQTVSWFYYCFHILYRQGPLFPLLALLLASHCFRAFSQSQGQG